MAQQNLDGSDICAGIEQMGGEGVPQHMGRDVLGQARRCDDFAQLGPNGVGTKVTPRFLPWKQPRLRRTSHSEIFSQALQHCLAEHHVAVLLAFALAHLDEHPLAVDVVVPQRTGFPYAQTGSIAGHKNRPVLQ